MKTILFLAVAVAAQAAGNVCLSLGMHQIGTAASAAGPGYWAELAVLALTSPWLWAGAGLLIIFTLLFTLVLSWTDLSLALPVISVEIVVNVALAGWLLGESISPLHWVGTVMVAAGVALVIGTAKDKPAPPEPEPNTAPAAVGEVAA
jgi:drug/metabolite transporter (DMT)-like permease